MPDRYAFVVAVLRGLALGKYGAGDPPFARRVSNHFSAQLASLWNRECPYCGARFARRASAWSHVVGSRWCAKELERDVLDFLERCGRKRSF